MIGDGFVEVQKKVTNVSRITICELECGSIVNEIAAIFGRAPLFQFNCKSYCTIARIPYEDLSHLLKFNKPTKTKLIQKLFENPYDIDRNFFCLQLRENVKYLKLTNESQLKSLYYQSEIQILDRGQLLFEVGDHINEIIVVLQGVVMIEILYDNKSQ